ncbi:MAG: hypothetical protein AAF936_11180 [Pseudomonadota bacterium]
MGGYRISNQAFLKIRKNFQKFIAKFHQQRVESVMVVINALEGLGLMEILIFGFIGANAALTGSFLVQRGLKRMTDGRLER